MPVTILPGQGSAASNFGSGLGEGLEQVIQWKRQDKVQQREQRHQQEMLQQSYALEAKLQQKAAMNQRENLEWAYQLEAERQLKEALIVNQQLETQLKANQLVLKKMITEQREYAHKVKVLFCSTFGLSILAVLLVLIIVFKHKQLHRV